MILAKYWVPLQPQVTGTSKSWPGNNWLTPEAKLLAFSIKETFTSNRTDMFAKSKYSGGLAKYATYVSQEGTEFTEHKKFVPALGGD